MNFPVVLALVLLSIALIVLPTPWLKHNTFLSMFIVSLLLGVVVLPAKDVVHRARHRDNHSRSRGRLCLGTLPLQKRVSELFDEAIEKAGPILVLTGAGGIFGAVIKATGVGDHAGASLAVTGLGLTIPLVISAFLKTAQGSSTVAIMTAASIVAPMLTAGY